MEPIATSGPAPVPSPAAARTAPFPLQRITALCDLTPAGINAATRAALLAREHGATLRLLSVWRRRAQVAVAQARLEALGAELRQRLQVTASVEAVHGNLLRQAAAAVPQTDLLVVRAAGTHAAAEWLLGTHPGRLLHCAGPLLVVRKPAAVGYQRVLAALAFDGGAVGVIAAAAGMMRGPHQQVLQAVDGHADLAGTGAGAADRLLAARRLRAVVQDVMADAAGTRAVAGAPQVVLAPAPGELLQKARSTLADLVVMARQPGDARAGWWGRSGTHQVMADVRADLLLLPWAVG